MNVENAGPAYLVGNYSITDGNLIMEYAQKSAPILQQYGGKIIALDRNVVGLDGSPCSFLIIVEFPDMDRAKQFFNSTEYGEIKHLRANSTSGGFIALSQGIAEH